MSKFINQETEAYLKRITGEDIHLQLQNIRERIDLESRDLSIIITEVKSLQEAQNQDRVDYFKTLEDAVRRLDKLLIVNEEFADAHIDRLEDQIKKLAFYGSITAGILFIGVIACLAKLLI